MLRNISKNKNFKRFGAILMTLTMTFAINSAISYAGGDTERATSSLSIPRDTPRPKATSSLSIPRDTPRPKATSSLSIPRDTPRP